MPVEQMVLNTLRREQVPLKISEIARWNNITSASTRRVLFKLQSEGLVTRNASGYWALVGEVEKEGGS